MTPIAHRLLAPAFVLPFLLPAQTGAEEEICVVGRHDSHANPAESGPYVRADWYAEVLCAEPREVEVEISWLDADGVPVERAIARGNVEVNRTFGGSRKMQGSAYARVKSTDVAVRWNDDEPPPSAEAESSESLEVESAPVRDRVERSPTGAIVVDPHRQEGLVWGKLPEEPPAPEGAETDPAPVDESEIQASRPVRKQIRASGQRCANGVRVYGDIDPERACRRYGGVLKDGE
jgi:hypothetical protein